MGLFSTLFGSKKEEPIKPVPPPKVKPTADPPKPFIPPEPKEKVDLTIPEWKDGAQRKYYYSVKIQVTDLETLTKRAQEKEFLLNVKEDIAGAIHVLSNGDDIGILLDRTDMVKDWLKRGDPYFFCIEHVYPDEPEKEAIGRLALYRDKRKGQDWRDQSVVALTAYKSDDKQESICFCKEGEELELEEDYEHEDAVIVFASGEEIGKLPKKYAVKYLEEDAYGAFFEKVEIDNDYKDKPFVRIYWNSGERPGPKYNLVDAKTIIPAVSVFDENHPLYQKSIIITGALSIPREKAMQAAADLGAILKNDISQKIDYLVVGEKDPAFCGPDGLSSKERKAHKLINAGKGHIQIISDSEFMKMLQWKPEE